MNETIIPRTITVVRWRLIPDGGLSDDAFLAICQANPDMRVERTAKGAIIIMPPAGAESSRLNLKLGAVIEAWAERDGTGVAFDSSAGFALPNGAIRSPDVAWVRRTRWDALTQAQRSGFPPLCPDFVVEIRSPTDRPRHLRLKMDEYVASGTLLGWLIDPRARTVEVYRPGRPVERLDRPFDVRGDPELPGLVVDLRALWRDGLA